MNSPMDNTQTSTFTYGEDGHVKSSPDKGTTNSNMEPMYYKLETLSGKTALERICQLTNNFDESLKMEPEFIEEIKTKLNTDDEIMEGFLYAPTDPDICKQVIGKGGYYFHLTTKQQDIAMIWHERDLARPVFRFWGEKFKLIKAMNIIRHRIHMKLND